MTDTANIVGSNSDHIVTGSGTDGTAVLDGFTINAGQADQTLNRNGAGMLNMGGSPTLARLTFSSNIAGFNGGGMSNNNSSSPTLIDVIFTGNSADSFGGGMYNNDASSPILINALFLGNQAAASGGGIYNIRSSSPALTNVVFSNNSAIAKGGGIFSLDNCSPALTNVTFYRNSADEGGGGIFNDFNSDPIIRNCIFQDDSLFSFACGNHICNNDIDSVPTIANSLVQRSRGSGPFWDEGLGVDGGGNIDADAVFLDIDGPDDTPGTLDDDLRLRAGSPAIDAGENTHIPAGIPTDIAGDPRIVDGDADSTATVDMGAYEFEPLPVGVYYVNDDASGAGTGLNWTDAFTDLQSALLFAAPGSQIWVAEGLYAPGTSATDTFWLVSGVEVYGGFQGLSGTEGDFRVRDPDSFLTVLSGDVDGDDITSGKGVVNNGFNIVGFNSHSVVTGSGTDRTAVLDGFTITAGQANDFNVLNGFRGGGMFILDGSPTLVHLTFTGNLADAGGGMATLLFSSPILNSVNFYGNSASAGGGVLFEDDSSPILNNVNITGNSASFSGGGMFIRNRARPTLSNAVFTSNSADNGGGICNIHNSSAALTNVTLYGNSARGSGGGMYNQSSKAPTIQNCILWANSADITDNQIYNDPFIQIAYTITDSLIQGGCPDDRTECFNTIDEDPLFVDTDGPDDVAGTPDDDLRLRPGSPAIDAGNNDHLPPDIHDLDGDNDTAEAIPFDLGGGDRVVGANVDMGAHEFPTESAIYYVNDDASGNGHGLDWTNAINDLQVALALALPGTEIWVAEGVYVPGASEEDTFQLKNGVQIYGGFEGTPGTEDNFGVRDPAAFLTILSGDIEGNDLTNEKTVVTDTNNIIGANCDHVVTGSGTDQTAVLDGVTITAGQADGPDPVTMIGGGMFVAAGNPTLTHLIFSGNSAEADGGGMYNSDASSPRLTDVTFAGNSAGDEGGGIYNTSSSSPTLTNVLFLNNISGGPGGGMNNNASSPTLTNVAFRGNSAKLSGGGMSNIFASSPSLTNVIFTGNSASTIGGGMRNTVGSNPALTNVTLSRNLAEMDGGGISNHQNSAPIIRNSILWGNRASGSGDQIFNENDMSVPTIELSLVQDSGGSGAGWDANLGTDGGGNVDADPLFVNADGPDNIPGTLDDNPRLQNGSPAIDAGDNIFLPIGTTTDLAGGPRIVDGDEDSTATVDMGAYEFQVNEPSPTPTPTGNGEGCNLNGDDRVDAFDLLILLESESVSESDLLSFARCWFEQVK